jgi:cysteine synthase A
MNGIAENITELVGNTPMVKLKKIGAGLPGEITGKLDFFNPCSSVKDRIALSMIQAAEKDGRIRKDTVVIEPTSGNTGIGLAFVCAQRGYRLVLTMPESMSVERRKLLAHLGAELVLTPPEKGMKGAIDKAEELAGNFPSSFIPMQFSNPVNPRIHRETTAQEILRDTGGRLDYFVAGVGTGGTLSGVGSVLREKIPGVKIIAVEPETSPVLSGGEPGAHKIQGIGAGFVPENCDTGLIDEVITIADDEAYETARLLARQEGILAGISSGANVAAALKIASRPETEGKRIVTFICDTGERYLSLF